MGKPLLLFIFHIVIDPLQRMNPIGWDRDGRTYYLLDDTRVYRLTDPPIRPEPKAKPKANSLKAQAARRRASKRRRIESSEELDVDGEEDTVNGIEAEDGKRDDWASGFKWECVATTLAQFHEFIDSFKKTKDPNEKLLRDYLHEEVIPIIEQAEEKMRRKAERREKELLNLQKLATAKRSSRVADRQERERQEREAIEAERKREADLRAAHKEQERQERMDQDRASRMMTREQRIKDREYKRLLHEEELAKMEEEAKKVEAGEARGSERHLKAQMEKRKKDLEDLSAEEDWVFDCSGCGIHGKNIDDGSHSVACEKCNVWQHSKCLGITKAEAEKDDFHFVCKDCKQRIADAKKPKIAPLKFRTGLSSSPPQPQQHAQHGSAVKQKFAGVEIPKNRGPVQQSGVQQPHMGSHGMNGYPVPFSSQLQRPAGSPYFQQPFYHQQASSDYQYGNGQQYVPKPPQLSPYANGFPSNIRSATSSNAPGQQQPYSNAYGMPNGYNPRPGSSSGQVPPRPFQQVSQSPPDSNSAHPTSSYGQYPPYYNGVPHQYQAYPLHHRPTSTHTPSISPRQPTAPTATNNNQSPSQVRMPSPIQNRPSMSPTQGNHEVGRIAGLPQRSPTASHPQQASPVLHQQSPAIHNQVVNGLNSAHTAATPAPISRSPNTIHMSGLSPTKHSPSVPPPSVIPQKNSMSPPPNGLNTGRSVSGTLKFPPEETFAPSPEQLSKAPVPTPAKSASPAQIGHDELQRVNMVPQGTQNCK